MKAKVDLESKSPWELTKLELDGIISASEHYAELKRRRKSKEFTYIKVPIPEDILNLSKFRQICRSNKKFDLADKIRDIILELGFEIFDTKVGFNLKKII